MQTENESIQQKVNQTITEAQRAIAAGDQQTALLLLDQVLSQHPDHPDANYQSALVDLQIKGSEAALKKFEKAVTNKPQSEKHWIGYIETLMETASLEIVLEALELGQEYSLSEKRAQYLASKFLDKKQNPKNQLFDNEQTNILESNELVERSKAVDLIDNNAQKDSASQAEDISDQSSDKNDSNHSFEKHTQASDRVSDHESSQKNNIDDLFEAALKAHENEAYDKAVENYLTLLAIDPKHAAANHNLGIIESHTKSADEALPRFEAAVMSEPKSEQYWVSYIDALVMSGAIDVAEQAISNGQKYGLSTTSAIKLFEELRQHHNRPDHENSRQAPNKLPITTIIPAYKVNYINDLLISLSAQTYRNFKVIISDDSPDNAVLKHINKVQEEGLPGISKNIALTVVEGPKKGSFANVVHLLNIWDGGTPLLHILFDDDIIYPTFYENHVAAHTNKNISSSISYRWISNEKGFPIRSPQIPDFIAKSDQLVTKVDAELLFKSTIPFCCNWLGEFSNAVFSREVALEFKHQSLQGIPYHGLGDIGLFLQGALQSEVAIVKEHLGSFRTNPHQNSVNKASISLWCGHVAWIALAFSAYKLNKINLDQVKKCIGMVNEFILRAFNGIPDLVKIAELSNQYSSGSPEYEKAFMTLWHTLLNKDTAWTTALKIKNKSVIKQGS